MSEEERLARRLERRRQEIISLKRTLEDGALVVILPTTRLTYPRERAGRVREAIELYQLKGDSAALSGLVPSDLWGDLRVPMGFEPAR